MPTGAANQAAADEQRRLPEAPAPSCGTLFTRFMKVAHAAPLAGETADAYGLRQFKAALAIADPGYRLRAMRVAVDRAEEAARVEQAWKALGQRQ